jgi:hypothetical protein
MSRQVSIETAQNRGKFRTFSDQNGGSWQLNTACRKMINSFPPLLS